MPRLVHFILLVLCTTVLQSEVSAQSRADARAKKQEVESYILSKYERDSKHLKGMKNLAEFIAFIEAKYHKAHTGGFNNTHTMWLFRPKDDPVGNCAFLNVFSRDPKRPDDLLRFDGVTIGKCAMFEERNRGLKAQ